MKVDVRREFNVELIQKWWRDRLDVEFTPDVLSDYGFSAFHEGNPIATIFLYPILGSKVAWLGWPIADKEVDKKVRDLALDEILKEIQAFAKTIGYKYIWTTSGVPVVKDRLLRNNYIEGDKGISQFWRVL